MKIIARLKKVNKFVVIDKKIAGLVLTGNEIKSVRNNQISINESYIFPKQKELYLYNSYISPYQKSHSFSSQYQSDKKNRKLLLKKNEITYLINQMKTKHYSLIPLLVFINEKGWAKVEIALVQFLRKFQLKAEVKDKEIKKKLQRREYD